MNDAGDFDLAEVGRVLVTVAAISRQLGHVNLFGTVRDYLAPHDVERSAEQKFVHDILVGGNPLSEETAIALLQGIDLPPLEIRRVRGRCSPRPTR